MTWMIQVPAFLDQKYGMTCTSIVLAQHCKANAKALGVVPRLTYNQILFTGHWPHSQENIKGASHLSNKPNITYHSNIYNSPSSSYPSYTVPSLPLPLSRR